MHIGVILRRRNTQAFSGSRLDDLHTSTQNTGYEKILKARPDEQSQNLRSPRDIMEKALGVPTLLL